MKPQGFGRSAWGEGLFIFRELGNTGNYFGGAGEHVYSLRDLGSSPCQKVKKNKRKENLNVKEKPPFC